MIHRDDMDFEDAEALQAHFEEMFPGSKVVFLGDIPEDRLTDEDREFAKRIEEQAISSNENGTCILCGAEIGHYDPTNENWNPPDGWILLSAIGDSDGTCWKCPACDPDEDEDEDDEEEDGVFGDFE